MVKLAKDSVPDKYVYSGYGIGFHSRSEFLLLDGSVGKNTNFGVDMSSSVQIDDKKKRYFRSWYRSNPKIRWHYAICGSSIFN